MRKIIYTIFFCFCCHAAMAQAEPENNDTLSLTNITTRDFMEGNGTGSMDWGAITYQAKWCFFGKCADDNLGITHVVVSCCSFGQWITKIFGGGGGSPTEITNNEEGGGGTGGGFIWIDPPYSPGGYGPPINPPTGGGGGGGTSPANLFGNVITPPPTKPATVLDNGDTEEGEETKKDSTPVKIDCSPESNTLGDSLTAVLYSIEASPQMTDLRTNLSSRKFEVGMSINFSPVTSYYPYHYVNNGQSKNVTLNIAAWTFAAVHTHPWSDSSGTKNMQSPSPLDYFFVTDSWYSYPTHRFKTNYVVAGNGNDYAVTIGDTANISLFLQNNNPNLLFDESTGIWKGSKTEIESPYYKFFKIVELLKTQGYNDETANDYANIIMATGMNMGLKYFKKINGKFKEQSFEEIKQGKKTKYILKICND